MSVYKYVETLHSACDGDVELFKHFLCEQLIEMNLTEEQLEYMNDKVWTIELANQIDSLV
jgi:hypothetical protein